MSNSLRNSPLRNSLALALWILAAAAADAQETASSGFAVEFGGGGAEKEKANPEKITSRPAEDITAEGFGLLDESNGGLPASMWKDTPRAAIGELLGLIRGGIAEPSVRELARALLLTQADVPAPSGPGGQDLFALRARALTAMGLADDAARMLERLPHSLHTSESEWLRAELALLKRDYAAGCGLIRDAVGRYEEARWQQALVFCQAQAGEKDAAALGLDLLREQNRSPSELFLEAIAALNGDAGAIRRVPGEISLFDAALLLAAARESVLADAVDRLPLAALPALASGEEHGAALRAAARSRLALYAPDGAEKERRSPPPEQQFAAAWKEAESSEDARAAHRLYLLAEALGLPRDLTAARRKMLLTRLRYGADFPSPLLAERLKAAAAAGRVGETALLAVLLAGGGPFAHASDYVLSDAIAALRLVGLRRNAEAVARDALAALELSNDEQ